MKLTTSVLPSDRSVDRRAPRLARVYWTAFGLIGALLVLWALANPPTAAPDENAHVVKAAAVVRGELLGAIEPDNPGSGVVEVPALVAYGMSLPNCFAFQSNHAASCMPPVPDDLETQTQAPTWVVRYNPLYYAIVGLPSLFPNGLWTFYAMRIVSALLCAAALAWGVRSLAEIRLPRFVALGILAATTPMVLFLGSTVNPSSLEICSAISLWISLLALLRAPDPDRLGVRMAGIAVLSVLLANSRGLSPFFLGVIALTTIAISPWRTTLDVLRDRRSWPWLGLIVAGFAASVAWIVLAGSLALGGIGAKLSFSSGLRAGVEQTPGYLQQMLGEFGWLDTPLPSWTYTLLALGAGAVVVLALLVHRRRRDAIAVVAIGAGALVLPVLIQAWQAGSVGIVWQGRYSMPLMVGLPIAAGFIARDGALPRGFKPRAFFVTAAALLGTGQIVAFAINVHRYMRGMSAAWFGTFPSEWHPPLPVLGAFAVFVFVYAGLVIQLDRVSQMQRSVPILPAPSAPPVAALERAAP